MANDLPERNVSQSMRRGFQCRCPNCGEGNLFGRFLKNMPACAACGETIDGHRADDFPAYIVITIVAHIVIGLVVAVEMRSEWPLWVHAALWLPLTAGLAIGLLQPVKGALIGYQWAMRMHGYDPAGDIHLVLESAAQPRVRQ